MGSSLWGGKKSVHRKSQAAPGAQQPTPVIGKRETLPVAWDVARARDRIDDIHCFLDDEELTGENSRKLRKALDEFDTYVAVNEALIPNYGERWRDEESIATGFVESAVNQIVSKRFAKKQQMQWTKKSAHLVLQMRTRGAR